jgi:hypothetical protein
MSKEQYFTLITAIISFILLFIIFKIIHHLAIEKYIVECFSNNNQTIMDQTLNKYLNKSTSNSVDLPITKKYSCQNFCGPNAKCAITGEQCFTDIDCQGCHDYSRPEKKTKDYIQGNDDAGKLTAGVTPQYSSLTSGYGTKERIITKNMYDKPIQANFGIDTWSKSFNEGQILFNKRYKPNQLQYMPNYKSMYSITGIFTGDGPLPSNY